ncbi:hypothetical protein I6E29_08490 [Arcanobacterium haemolyticum]|nr:hypothetical protein [Arcanobacterium haemolyticum]
MFGRKKKQRILSDWPSLQDALIAFYDAKQTSSGAMELVISWKAEKRSQVVQVAYASVPGIGPIAFIGAPLGLLGDDEWAQVLPRVSALLVGGMTRDDEGMAYLRATIPFEGVNFDAVSQTIVQIASSADALKEGLAA